MLKHPTYEYIMNYSLFKVTNSHDSAIHEIRSNFLDLNLNYCL